MFFTFVLYSSVHQKIYTGYTSDLIDRFHSHNQFGTKGYTVKFRPWEVVTLEDLDKIVKLLKVDFSELLNPTEH